MIMWTRYKDASQRLSHSRGTASVRAIKRDCCPSVNISGVVLNHSDRFSVIALAGKPTSSALNDVGSNVLALTEN